MRTEIVVPFAIDTAPIEKRMQEHGQEEADKVLERIVRENIVACVPKKVNYYGVRNGEPDWGEYLRVRVQGLIDDHTQEIIDEAALLLAMRAGKKKKWRDVLAEIKAEREAEDDQTKGDDDE